MTGERFVCRPMIGIPFVTATHICLPNVLLPDSGLPASKLGRLRPSRMRSSTTQSDGAYFMAFISATVSNDDFTLIFGAVTLFRTVGCTLLFCFLESFHLFNSALSFFVSASCFDMIQSLFLFVTLQFLQCCLSAGIY